MSLRLHQSRQPPPVKKLSKKAAAAEAKATATAAGTGKKQKKRVKKDKNAPKKPMSPFFCYQHVRRPAIKAEDPTISNNNIISKMAAEWRAMTPEAQ